MTAQAQAKAPSKMERAKALYAEVFSKGYDLEGKSQRKVFTERAMAEIGLTKNGANTYFQNLSNANRGQALYKYNKAAPKSTPPAEADNDGLPPTVNVPSRNDVEHAEQQVAGVIADLTHRWKVQNEAGVIVNSFTSRDKARKYVEMGNNLTIIDSKASA